MAQSGSQYPYLPGQQVYLPSYYIPMTTMRQGAHATYPPANYSYMGGNIVMHGEQRDQKREVKSEPNRDTSSLSPDSVQEDGESQEDNQEYMTELIKEKKILNQNLAKAGSKGVLHISQLLDREISLAQSGLASPMDRDDKRMLDVYREKPVRVVVKVAVPVKEHPKFNFVGKLLGPKGNSLKRLQEDTRTKMAVLGKGSMRDKGREEELRLSKDPKYIHLSKDLHVEITAFAPPADAYARLSYALTEVRKYLIPDSNDHIRQIQMKELDILSNSENIICDQSNSHQLSSTLKTMSPTQFLQPLQPMQPLQSLQPLQPMQPLQPLLVPSSISYLNSQLPSLLPTPPLEQVSIPSSPIISTQPIKYSEVDCQQDIACKLKLSVREDRVRDRKEKCNPY